MAKTSFVAVMFMVLLTFFIIFFAYNMPDYFGVVKTFFYVLGLISAIKTLRIGQNK